MGLGGDGCNPTRLPACFLLFAGPAKLGDLLEHCLPVSSLFTLLAPFAVPDQPEVLDHPDRPLIVRARAGDSQAFRTLFERHGRPVWRFAQDSLQDPAMADEVAQETFVRAHAALGRLRDEDRLLPWLLGIARRVCLEHHRRRGPESAGTAEEAEQRSSLSLPTAATPEQLLLDEETEALLGAALGTLRESRRTALLLRLDHGLGYEEIASVMGWSLPKVKNEIHRARLQLRSQLAEHVGVKP